MLKVILHPCVRMDYYYFYFHYLASYLLLKLMNRGASLGASRRLGGPKMGGQKGTRVTLKEKKKRSICIAIVTS